MPSYRDLLKQAKSQIREVETDEADALRAEPGAVVLDVREPEEFQPMMKRLSSVAAIVGL